MKFEEWTGSRPEITSITTIIFLKELWDYQQAKITWIEAHNQLLGQKLDALVELYKEVKYLDQKIGSIEKTFSDILFK